MTQSELPLTWGIYNGASPPCSDHTEGDIAAVIELADFVWRHRYPGIVSTEQKL
jgi:hypothetical protein